MEIKSGQLPRIELCNVLINNITMKETVENIIKIVDKRDPEFIVTPNTDHLVRLQIDKKFKKSYNKAILVIPDGMPLLWASYFLGTHLREKVSGSDLFVELCALAVQKHYRLFFLGGRSDVAFQASEVLKQKFPGIQVVGAYSPPFGFEKKVSENKKIIKMIQIAKPDILFVGFGSPKQERWIDRFRYRMKVPVSIGIGISFEYTAGIIKRAPKWAQKIGLEWLFRLVIEPRRLWKRYLIDDMWFFWLILKQKVLSIIYD